MYEKVEEIVSSNCKNILEFAKKFSSNPELFLLEQT